jgi:sugar lactone lactonase YvrE
MTMTIRSVLTLLLAAILAGCGGGSSRAVLPGTSDTSSAPAASARTSASFTIAVPAKSVQTQSRNPQYISVNTESVIITLATVNGTAFTGPQAETAANLTSSNPSCSGSPLTCAITVPAAAGTDVFTVSTYSAQQTSAAPAIPAGSVLSTGTVSVNVVSGQANAPATALVLNGVVASVVATFPSDPHISGTQSGGYAIVGSQPYALTVSPVDASGATIVGDGAPTFAVTSGTNAVAVSSSGADTFTVRVQSYSATPVNLAITPSSGTVTNLALTTVQELWVSDYTANTVTAYGLAATPTPISSDTITAGLSMPVGIAVDASGDLWVANIGGHNVTVYAPGTNTAIAADTISAGLNSPAGLAFDASGSLWVADAGLSIIEAFVPGTNTPIAGDTITAGVSGPQDLAFDASGHLWVANTNASDVIAFSVTPTPTQITADTITAGLSGPDGLTFDASGLLRVADQTNSTITAYTPGTSTAISADTVSGSGGVSSPQHVRFDASGRMWVANQTNGMVTAYAPGTTTPISADTISGFHAAGGLAFSP